MNREPVPPFKMIRSHRHAAARWFQAENSTARSRDADRPATIAGVCSGEDARGYGSSRAAGRAAARPGVIPGIMRLAEEDRFRSGGQAKLRCCRLAEDDHSGSLIARHESAIV